MRGWRVLAWSLPTLSVLVGSSLLLRPPTGGSSYTLARISDLVAYLVLGIGLVKVCALLTRTWVAYAFGLGAAVYTMFAVALWFGVLFGGSGWSSAALATQVAVANFVVLMGAAPSRPHEHSEGTVQ